MKITTSTAFASILAPVVLGQTETQLTPSDTAQFARYGISAAVDGNRTVIGATAAVTAGAATGAAYVFDSATGLQTMRLSTTNTVGARFAQGVAVEGNRVYVTAPFRHQLVPSFQTRVGGAYVFDATTGQQLDLFLPPGVVPNTEFGLSVDVDGGRLAVGARATTAPFVEPGTVYVLDAQTGQQLHQLLALDGQDEDELGESVAIDGGLVVSGAPGDDDNGFRSGSAYVFDALTGAQLVKLMPNDPSASQNFGLSVAIQGRHVVVGATGGFGGSAYVFDALTGQQLMKLVANDVASFDLFGHAVAIEGGRVIVSAPQRDELGLVNAGAVYVFDLANGQQLAKLVDSNGGAQHFFGYALGASRDTVATGSPFANTGSLSNSGAANVFDLGGGPNNVISFCDPLGANTVSSSGALLSSTGGFGTSAATFNITGIPNSFGLLFAGNGETSNPVGCGTLCVSGAIVRGPVLTAQGNQILGATFDMAPISTPRIQYWFREIGACPGGSSNLSNALKQ